MSNEALTSFVYLYNLVPTTLLKAYQQELASILFGLKKTETNFASFNIFGSGHWQYTEKKKNMVNPFAEGQKSIPQTKQEAIEIATKWLHQSSKKIHTAIQEKRLDEALVAFIPSQFLRLESATPIYKENSKLITHWELRYFMELCYNADYKARVQGQNILLKTAQRLIGIEFGCPTVSTETTPSYLVVPAGMKDLPNIEAAQFAGGEGEHYPLLPLVFVQQKGAWLLPFWVAQNGEVLPAVREGEVLEEYGNSIAYIYDISGRHVNTKTNARSFVIYVLETMYIHSIEGLGGDDYLKGKTDAELKEWSSFYISENTLSQGAFLAKQQDDKAKKILKDKELGTLADRLKLMLDEFSDSQVTELAIMLCIAKDSKEAAVIDTTKHIDKGNLGTYSINMKKIHVENITKEMELLGYIPVCHGHTHGRYYSLIGKNVGHDYKKSQEDIDKILNNPNSVIANPSSSDHAPHFFDEYKGDSSSRIKIIFTDAGFTLYSSNVYLNTGDFFDYKIRIPQKTQSE